MNKINSLLILIIIAFINIKAMDERPSKRPKNDPKEFSKVKTLKETCLSNITNLLMTNKVFRDSSLYTNIDKDAQSQIEESLIKYVFDSPPFLSIDIKKILNLFHKNFDENLWEISYISQFSPDNNYLVMAVGVSEKLKIQEFRTYETFTHLIIYDLNKQEIARVYYDIFTLKDSLNNPITYKLKTNNIIFSSDSKKFALLSESTTTQTPNLCFGIGDIESSYFKIKIYKTLTDTTGAAFSPESKFLFLTDTGGNLFYFDLEIEENTDSKFIRTWIENPIKDIFIKESNDPKKFDIYLLYDFVHYEKCILKYNVAIVKNTQQNWVPSFKDDGDFSGLPGCDEENLKQGGGPIKILSIDKDEQVEGKNKIIVSSMARIIYQDCEDIYFSENGPLSNNWGLYGCYKISFPANKNFICFNGLYESQGTSENLKGIAIINPKTRKRIFYDRTIKNKHEIFFSPDGKWMLIGNGLYKTPSLLTINKENVTFEELVKSLS